MSLFKFNPSKIKQAQSTLTIVNRRSDESNDEIEAIEECVKDLLAAFSLKDTKKIAKSIKDIHDVLHSYMDETDNSLTNTKTYEQEK